MAKQIFSRVLVLYIFPNVFFSCFLSQGLDTNEAGNKTVSVLLHNSVVMQSLPLLVPDKGLLLSVLGGL